MGNNSNSQELNNETENEEQWDQDSWDEQQDSSADVELEKKDLDVDKAKIRKSIEDFQEQKRLKELLGDDYED